MKRYLPCLAFVLAAGLLFLGFSLGCSGLEHSRVSGVSLWEPPVQETRKAPAVLLCGGSRGIAIELARRGYVVAACAPGKEKSAYALLTELEQVELHNVGLVAASSGAAALIIEYDRVLTATEHYPWALILWNCSAEDTEGLANVLTISGGEEQALEGYFAEGSARKTVRSASRRADMLEVIEWLGSTLGHPRDGVLDDDAFVFPASGVCYGLSAALTLVGLMLIRKREGKTENAEGME